MTESPLHPELTRFVSGLAFFFLAGAAWRRRSSLASVSRVLLFAWLALGLREWLGILQHREGQGALLTALGVMLLVLAAVALAECGRREVQPAWRTGSPRERAVLSTLATSLAVFGVATVLGSSLAATIAACATLLASWFFLEMRLVPRPDAQRRPWWRQPALFLLTAAVGAVALVATAPDQTLAERQAASTLAEGRGQGAAPRGAAISGAGLRTPAEKTDRWRNGWPVLLVGAAVLVAWAVVSQRMSHGERRLTLES